MGAYLNALMEEGTREELFKQVIILYNEKTVLLARIKKLEAVAKEGKRLQGISEAFLKYFNPLTDLPSNKEDQWWSVYDQIEAFNMVLDALDAPNQQEDKP